MKPDEAIAPSRILIVKPSSLGDVVTAVPVLRGLRRAFPQAHIAWLLAKSCAPVVEHDSELDEVILFDRRKLGSALRRCEGAAELVRLVKQLRAGRFDWVLDLQGLLRSGLLTRSTGAPLRAGFADAREGAWLFYNRRIKVSAAHTVERNIELAGHLGVSAGPGDIRLEVAPAGRQFADEFCRTNGLSGGDFVVAVPPARWQSKLYPVRHWRTVVAQLVRQAPVVVIGGPDEVAICDKVASAMPKGVFNLAGRTSVQQMVGLIAEAALVISSDSAAKFIAPAVGVEALTLIGPTRVELTGPWPSGKVVAADIPCQGCLKRYCRHNVCMQLIEPSDVVEAAAAILAARSR